MRDKEERDVSDELATYIDVDAGEIGTRVDDVCAKVQTRVASDTSLQQLPALLQQFDHRLWAALERGLRHSMTAPGSSEGHREKARGLLTQLRAVMSRRRKRMGMREQKQVYGEFFVFVSRARRPCITTRDCCAGVAHTVK